MGSIETARTHQGVTEGAQREGVYAIFLCVPSIHRLAPCEAGLRVTMGDLSISPVPDRTLTGMFSLLVPMLVSCHQGCLWRLSSKSL